MGILNEGTIAVAAADGTTDKPAYTAAGEKDYMYSSRNDEVGARSSTTARLVMEHVLSRVSFRMYASAAAQAAVEGDENSYYEFVGYMLKNRSGSEELVARFDGNTRMSVGTGEITGALSGARSSAGSRATGWNVRMVTRRRMTMPLRLRRRVWATCVSRWRRSAMMAGRRPASRRCSRSGA